MRSLLSGDEAASQAIADAVGTIEARTDAELVVVLRRRSDDYADAASRGGWCLALPAALLLLFAPFTVGEAWFLLDVAAAWWLGSLLPRHPAFLRWLTTASRRRDAVREAAAAAFHHEAVHGTPRRTGVLIYVAVDEQRVEVIADLGVEGQVPRGELAAAAMDLEAEPLDRFLQGLEVLGQRLADHLPHRPDSDDTNLPNEPRIRP